MQCRSTKVCAPEVLSVETPPEMHICTRRGGRCSSNTSAAPAPPSRTDVAYPHDVEYEYVQGEESTMHAHAQTLRGRQGAVLSFDLTRNRRSGSPLSTPGSRLAWRWSLCPGAQRSAQTHTKTSFRRVTALCPRRANVSVPLA